MKKVIPYISDFLIITILIPFISGCFFLWIWKIGEPKAINIFVIAVSAILGVLISSPLNLIGWAVFLFTKNILGKAKLIPYIFPFIALSYSALSISKNESSMFEERVTIPIFILIMYLIYWFLNKKQQTDTALNKTEI